MNIAVEYIDTAGVLHNQIHRIIRVAFAKHLAISGQGYSPRIRKLIRSLSMFYHYSHYLQSSAFDDDRFSEPPIELSDPTEKGQFSNLAGKAIADFLSKKIDKSLFTVNYEAAMRLRTMPLTVGGNQVKRPDLLAFAQNSMFAIEAKGFSGGPGKMIDHKDQSKAGGIPVNYSIAAVSYNLYSGVKCKYHDPFNDNVPFDKTLFSGLTKIYYKGLLEFLDRKFFDYRISEFQGEKFYEIELSHQSFRKYLANQSPFGALWQFEIFDYYRPRLILPENIRAYAESGLTNEVSPFLFDDKEQREDIYIDNDRVGLRFGR